MYLTRIEIKQSFTLKLTHRELVIHCKLQPAPAITQPIKDEQGKNEEIVLRMDIRNRATFTMGHCAATMHCYASEFTMHRDAPESIMHQKNAN